MIDSKYNVFDIVKNVKTPTGNICIMKGETGNPLEFLSLGDYGKENNVKADFMGITRPINGVEHTDLLPLEEKWVVTISSQYGCSMGCKFCDVPKVGPGNDATYYDLIHQITNAMSLHPEVTHSKQLNIHFARMGEPTWNNEILNITPDMISVKEYIDIFKNFTLHPVISTMMPKNNKWLENFICYWLRIKNHVYLGEAGLQLSINTTDDIIRDVLFNHNSYALKDISDIMKYAIQKNSPIIGRKITLNFALTDAPIDTKKLRAMFDPQYFMVKITPMHKTQACRDNNLQTTDGYDAYYPYEKVEQELINEGFDVLVFIPSKEEDDSRITCGNAILSDPEFKSIRY